MATKALYRQWRPVHFADVVGQDAIVTTLKNQIASGRVGHAYLFCGSRGTGKTTMAKLMARAVNCQSPKDGDPCGECPACDALSDETNMDVVEIDAASNNGVDEIRDLRDKIKYPPQHARFRVYIIDEVHMLSTGAFNALLKTLEEPPSHALFILATTEPQKLPATVLSRCQRYDFRRIPAATIVSRMQTVVGGEHVEATDEALYLIARAAEGGMRDALSLLDMCIAYGGGSVDASLVREVLGSADRGFLFGFTDNLIGGNAAQLLSRIDELMRTGREVQVFVRDMTGHLRALLLAKTCGDALADLLECTQEDAEAYAKQADRVSRDRLLSMMDLFIGMEADMKWTSQPRVALEMAAVRACVPDDAHSTEALSARIALLEQKIAQGVAISSAPKAAAKPTTAKGSTQVRTTTAAKPATPPSASGKELWDAAMQIVKRDPGLYGSFMQGKFAGFNENIVTVTFPKTGAIYRDLLAKGDRQQRLEEMFAEAAGQPITIVLAMEEEGAAEKAQQKDLMGEVFSVFGRENVQVVDHGEK